MYALSFFHPPDAVSVSGKFCTIYLAYLKDNARKVSIRFRPIGLSEDEKVENDRILPAVFDTVDSRGTSRKTVFRPPEACRVTVLVNHSAD